MIKSMTGYGRAEGSVGDKNFTIEIRSLNSKQMDINLRMPSIYKEKEMDLRKYLSSKLGRGKVDVSIYYESSGNDKKVSINKALMQSYFEDLKEMGSKFGEENVDYLALMLRIPDVLKPEKEDLDENEWNAVLELIKKASVELDNYRVQEGKAVGEDFSSRIQNILKMRDDLEGPIQERITKIKSKITTNLQAVSYTHLTLPTIYSV